MTRLDKLFAEFNARTINKTQLRELVQLQQEETELGRCINDSLSSKLNEVCRERDNEIEKLRIECQRLRLKCGSSETIESDFVDAALDEVEMSKALADVLDEVKQDDSAFPQIPVRRLPTGEETD